MRIPVIVRNHLISTLKNPLILGSIAMFVGTNMHNAGQLLYHFLAINFLTKAHYGDLAAVISIFGILAIIQQSLGLAVVKFIASSKSDREANNLANWVFFWSLWFSAGLAIFIFLLTPLLTKFLNITQPNAVYLFAPILFLASISNTGRALLQGFTKFVHLSGSMIAEVIVKILLTVFLLYLGYELLGAMGGLLAGVVAGLIIVWLSLKNRISGKRNPMPGIRPLLTYSLPVLVQSVATTSMYSTDIILVKHFFSPESAGAYAALAKFGTIALFAASPITHVMFPLIAKKHTHGEPYHKIFYLSLLLVALISSAVVLVYAFFGSEIARALTTGKYTEESHLLWWFGLYMLLLGMAMLFTQFYLSVGKTKVVWLFALAAVTQITLILFFHKNLINVVHSSVVSGALLVLCLSLYFPYHDKK